MRSPGGVTLTLAAIFLTLTLAGCGTNTVYDRQTVTPVPQTSPPTATVAAIPTREPTTTAPRLPTSNSAEPVEMARSDLARRLNLPVTSIALASVTQDMFPAQNLGCPEAKSLPKTTPRAAPVETSEVTLPAFVNAFEVRLKAGTQVYVYRVRDRQVVYCGEE